jgi:hypothetical protein
MKSSESLNSSETPTEIGQVSVFTSPAGVVCADIAVQDYRNVITWQAIPHESNLFEAVMGDLKDGCLNQVNYSFYLEPNFDDCSFKIL